jgi:TonB family protein
MAKPLRSDDPRPQSVQFTHFGVLNDGKRSKGAAVTSMVINGLIVLIIVLLGLVVKSNPTVAKQLTELTLPPEPPPPPVVKRPPPPPPPKPLPPTPKITPPKTVDLPPEIKPIEVPIPKPVVLAPAPPKAVTPPPAPVHIDLANKAAAIKNNDPKPSAVRLGNETNPLDKLNGPAVSRVNMGNAGAPGMNASNTGSGPRAASVSLGNGNPNGQNINGSGKGNVQIAGVRLGTPGSNGPIGSRNYGNQPVQVQLQSQARPPATNKPIVNPLTAASAPKVIYKPTPVYTAEAKSLHLEGNVSVKIKVLASGAVQVESITHGLGHGLDESARQAVLGTRFKPAVDANGNPIDWEGVVLVNFQLS